MVLLAIAVTVLAAAELVVAGAVNWLKRGCPWIVTARDLDPVIDVDGLARFVDHGWDAELGWVRKPGTAHDETGAGGRGTRYHIGPTGARRDSAQQDSPWAALAYGDSYTFCRQVDDDETWPHHLSDLIGGLVANFGVGNYGIDQALLRLEREFDDHPAPVVIMGVVPETICRIGSVWKHFSEYGNVFAFKPRFALSDDGALRLLPNPARDRMAFHRIAEMLPALMAEDVFFDRKFAPDMLRSPYLFHLWRSRRRNLPLIGAALVDRLADGGNRAFCRVMERNIALAAELYSEVDSLDLLVAVTRRFADFVAGKGATPVVLIMPQLYDLARLRAGDHYYAPFIQRVSGWVRVVDMGPVFAADHDDSANYIDDQFGGHLSAHGNRIVARSIASTVSTQTASRFARG